MSKQTGLLIGTLVYAILGVLAAIAFYIYVGMKSPSGAIQANRRIALVSVAIGTVSMYIMWACTYMHQMYPLIRPIISKES